MHGIHIAEILTIGIAFTILVVTLRNLKLPANGRLVWLAGLIVLPLQPLAYYLVRVPLDHWLSARFGAGSTTYSWLVSLYAPLTEEPAKLVPLLVPAIFRDIRRENFVRYAIVIGFCFAIGEMWFIADRIAQVPEYAGMPFYKFGGYMGERLMTCVFHSTFVAVALWRLRRGFALGFAGAAALHWLGNFPIFLMVWNVGGLGKGVWSGIVFGFLLLYFFGALALLTWFTLGKFAPGRAFYGIRHCPECDQDYDAPFFALNFGATRYERCPHCRRWHWTKARKA